MPRGGVSVTSVRFSLANRIFLELIHRPGQAGNTNKSGDIVGYVILTAAVTPDPRYGSSVSDPKIRLAQYQRALVSWTAVAEKLNFAVLVVETTGYAKKELLAPLANAGKSVEVMNFTPDALLLSRGKGAVEASAIDFLIAQAELADSDSIYKATGRLTLYNSTQILGDVGVNSAIARRSVDRRYCDSRLFVTTAGFWRLNLSEMADEVYEDRGRYLEHVLAHRLTQAEYLHDARIERFARRPVLEGVSGTSGLPYRRIDGAARSKLVGPVEDIFSNHLLSKQI